MSKTRGQARQILEVIPRLMCRIRVSMREAAGRDLTVPQFRILAFLAGNPQATASEMAQHQGVSLPAMSKAVDHLVKGGLLERLGQGRDRRKMSLGLTTRGRRRFHQARAVVEEKFSRRMAQMGPSGRVNLRKALEMLEKLA